MLIGFIGIPSRADFSERSLPYSGTPTAVEGASWLSRDHWDDARRVPGHPMGTRGDDCGGRQCSRTLHYAGNSPRHFLWCSTNGKKIEVGATNFYRLSGGQLVEEHGQPDLLGLLQKTGAIPSSQGQESV